jgi:3'-5' exonuclease
MKDLQKKERNLLFIDIETVSTVANYEQLSESWKKHWDKKASYLKNEEQLTPAQMYERRAGIYAEFGKIIVIGLGFFHWEDDSRHLKIKAIANHNETELLSEFKQIVERKYRPQDLILCAHNGKEFDYPYLCRRMLVNDISIPQVLQLQARKPWEVPHIDTLDMWKFGDRKHYTSLDLLSLLLEIPSSKNNMSGEDVGRIYYQKNDLEHIRQYCMNDVVALAQLYLKYQNEPLVEEDYIMKI